MDLLKPSYASGYAKNASQSAHPNLWDGLVGAWMPTLGVTGETLRDVSGNGNHGTLTGMDAATDWVATSKGLALDFDGVDDYVNTNSSVVSLDDDFTFLVAVRTPSSLSSNSTFRGLISKGDLSSKWASISYNANGNRFAVGIDDGAIKSELFGSIPLSPRKFYSVAGVFRRGKTLELYVNAELDGSTSDNSGSCDISENVFIGSRKFGSAQYFMRDLFLSASVYNRALSLSEIKHLYVDSLAPFRTKKRTVVRVPAAIPAATKVGSFKKPTTIIKPSYQAGYARNASESENPKLWDGLVGAWMPSLGVTGSKVPDVTGKATDAYLQNVPETNWMTDKGKTAILLDGGNSNDYLSAAHCDAFNFGSESFTAITLLNYHSLASLNAFLDFRTAASPNLGFHTYIRSSGTFQTQLRSSTAIEQYAHYSLPVSNNQWQMFVTRVDRRRAKCETFLNGKRYGASSISSAMGDINSGEPARFGINARDLYEIYASFASVLIYKRAISDTEIKHLYVDSLAPFRKKQRVSVAVPAAVAPSATYHPLRSLAHPLEQ